MKSVYAGLVGGMLLLAVQAAGQTLEELVAAYPDDNAVILNYTKEMTFFIENGEPRAESRITVDIMALNDRANGVYNRYGIYHGAFDPVDKIEAYTDVPAKRGYDKVKVQEIKTENARRRSVFYDDVKVSSFDFPSLKKGAIAHVSYIQKHNDVHMLSPLYFMSYMPVVNQRISISYPKQMVLSYKLKNDSLLHQVQVVSGKRGSSLTYTFTANNIKPVDRMDGAPAPAYDEPHAIIYISSFLDADGQKRPFLDNLDELYQWNYGFLQKMPAINTEKMQRVADSLTQHLHSETEKVRAIYSWVQSSIKYVAFENGLEGFIPRPADLVYDRKFGDCKDMASLLTTLLNLAGVKAWFTWIGSRDIPYDYTDVALPITDNHMICTARADGEWIFLDGTDPGCLFGYPTAFIQGKQALVAISAKEYKLLRIPEIEADKNQLVDSTLISITDQGIKGISHLWYSGYKGVDAYNNFSSNKNPDDNKEDVKYYASKGNNKFSLDSFYINYVGGVERKTGIHTQFTIPGYCNKAGDEMYINLNIDKLFSSNSVIDTARYKTDYSRRYKFVNTQYTRLQVPAGYEVEYLPDNYRYQSDLLSIEISYQKQPQAIVAFQQLKVNSLMLNKARFADWNNCIRKILSQYKEQVILKQQQTHK